MSSISFDLIEVTQLVKKYPSVVAVQGVSFTLKAGTCFGLLGPNGAGKTTTMEMIEGITPPSSGEIRFKGQPITANFKERIGIQFQSTALPDFLTVREVLKLFRSFYQETTPLESLIELCSLGEFLDRDTQKISGGQRQRLLLALALVNNPDLVFLDEPTTGLDPQARRNFWELVRTIRKNGKTIFMSTHYMEEAEVLCDEIAIMDHGKIIAQGVPNQLLGQHKNLEDLYLEMTGKGLRL
jgi:ABC-2 type transport system ATP-binding protein